MYLEIVGYLICMTMLRARFVNLRNLQTALRNLGIVHVQLINFWPNSDHNPRPSQIMQHNFEIVRTDRPCATVDWPWPIVSALCCDHLLPTLCCFLITNSWNSPCTSGIYQLWPWPLWCADIGLTAFRWLLETHFFQLSKLQSIIISDFSTLCRNVLRMRVCT